MQKMLSFISLFYFSPPPVSTAPGFSNDSGKNVERKKKKKKSKKLKKSEILARLSFLESSESGQDREAKAKEEAELERIQELSSGRPRFF